MEEQVKSEQVAVEVEEKKGVSKKKLLAIGGTVLGLVAAGVFILTRGKNQEDSQNQIINATYEPVESDSNVDQQND